MVRKSREKSGEEAEEDGSTGRTGESHHHPEYQHKMHHHTEVSCADGGCQSSIPAVRGGRSAPGSLPVVVTHQLTVTQCLLTVACSRLIRDRVVTRVRASNCCPLHLLYSNTVTQVMVLNGLTVVQQES